MLKEKLETKKCFFNCLGQTNYGGRSLSTAESPNCRYDCQSFSGHAHF